MIRKYLRILAVIMISFSLTVPVLAEETDQDNTETTAFHYIHDPMEYSDAAGDIIVNPDAVYGYSPNPDSDRLGSYVTYIDWTDPEQVENAREKRQAYFEQETDLYDAVEQMLKEGEDAETIARFVSKKRNENRIASYKDDPNGLETVKESNLEKYGNEEGPTAEYLYDRYGSWYMVILKSMSVNPGMDACLGLFDEHYETYLLIESLEKMIRIVAIATGVEPAPAQYVVMPGDTLWMLGMKYYDNGMAWKDIYDHNRDVIACPDLIMPGLVLQMP